MSPYFRCAARTLRFLFSEFVWQTTVLTMAIPGVASALNPHWSLGEYAHEAWTQSDGTIPARPFAIAQGKDGFIWVGTGNGLLRFGEILTAFFYIVP